MQIKVGNQVIVTGKLIKDAEFRRVGQSNIEQTRFAVSIGREDPLISCTAWRSTARVCMGLRKNQHVLVAGTWDEREYNGKIYESLIVDFIAAQAEESAATASTAFDSFPDTNIPDDLF